MWVIVYVGSLCSEPFYDEAGKTAFEDRLGLRERAPLFRCNFTSPKAKRTHLGIPNDPTRRSRGTNNCKNSRTLFSRNIFRPTITVNCNGCTLRLQHVEFRNDSKTVEAKPGKFRFVQYDVRISES